MREGWFTGKRLSDYISNEDIDYLGARAIINGSDRATQIADYAKNWGACHPQNQQQIPAVVPPPAEVQQDAPGSFSLSSVGSHF